MMKNIKTNTLMLMCLLALLATACNVNEPILGDSFTDRIPISLSGGIVQDNQTRANDSGFAENDKIGLFVVNYAHDITPGNLSEKNNQANNVGFTFDGNSTWTPDYDIFYKDKSTHVDFYGYYPYASSISSISAYPYEVAEDQSDEGIHNQMASYEASDFLWAKTENVTPTSNKVMLSFKHKMSSAKIVLTKGEGFEEQEWDNLSKQVIVSNTKRTSTINLATGEVTATGAIPARGTIPFKNNDGSFRAIVVPQSINANVELVSITIGGVSYSYSESSAFEYLAGKMHVFNITVDKKEQATGYNFKTTISISDWENDGASHDFTMKEYVVVNVETPGTLGTTLTGTGKDVTKIKNLKVTGTINADDFYFMRDQMSSLSAINMGEALITDNIIPNGAFENKTNLTSFVFPENIIKIGESAFRSTSLSGCANMPNSISEIGNYSFSGTNITDIVFPSNLETIGEWAFSDCHNLLISPRFPISLKTIGQRAFWSAGLSGNLILPSNLEAIGENAFAYCSGLSGDIIIPQKIKRIENGLFYYCSGLNGSLSLPEGLEYIGNSSFWGCNLKGDLVLPRTLTKIGDEAFRFNQFYSLSTFPEDIILSQGIFQDIATLSGIIEFPEGMSAIPQNLFSGCSNILGIVIPSSVDVIGPNAFNNCSNITSLVCHSEIPPTVGQSAFDGVLKDNFTVEVPENSVSDYQLNPKWNEFKRFSAHRNFSVNRNLFRALNKTDQITLILRADSDADWTAAAFNSDNTSADWIHMSNTAGTGITEITISLDALTKGAGKRDGYVLFSLTGKEYSTRTTIEQYDYEYNDGDIINHMVHSVGDGIPLIFMGDCYDAKDIADGLYKTDLETAISHFFDIEPYKTYKNYFDAYIVFGLSPDSGIGSVNTIKDSKFNSQYMVRAGKNPRDYSTIFQYAQLPDNVNENNINHSLITLIINSTDYWGITHLWNDDTAIAFCSKSSNPYPYDFRGIVQHEAGGHGFGKLGDEYIYTNAFIDACGCGYEHLSEFRNAKANGWYKNLSETADIKSVPWSHLIFNPTYSGTVDVYEGGYFHTRGIFRSESNSCMNNNVPRFSAISRQAIVERICTYSGVGFDLQTFYDNDVLAKETKSYVLAPQHPAVPSNSINNIHNAPIIMNNKPEI